MIANRELGLEDYLNILRRRRNILLIPALILALAGILVSFFFSPRYTSRSLVVVERQTVPSGYVKPIVTTTVNDRITMLQQQVLSRSRLELLINRLGLLKSGKTADEVIDEIQNNISIIDAEPGGPSVPAQLRKNTDLPGFYVSFTTSDPQNAQLVCREITSLLLAENLKSREQVALSTTDFLSRQLEEAKDTLEELDKKLAAFKSHYLGQLPGDVGNNLKILEGLSSQLDATTQMLNRAQQDKAYSESVVAQQVSAWKSSQTSLTSETIEHQLALLQTQLVAVQARYTDDHPEVIKLKSDIAGLKNKQKEMNAPSTQTAPTDASEGKTEPPEIRQLRLQIHQNEGVIARASQEQLRLQGQINLYQSRLTLSPSVEEQYKQLTRDYETAQKLYDTLLTNKSESEIQTDLEHRQQGEQMRLLDPASLPRSPSFPVRWQFLVGGLGAGLAAGIGIAMWLEFRDTTLHDEEDVMAGLEIPMLTAIPWVGTPTTQEQNGFRGRIKALVG